MQDKFNNGSLLPVKTHDKNKQAIVYSVLSSDPHERIAISTKIGKGFKQGDIVFSATYYPTDQHGYEIKPDQLDRTAFIELFETLLEIMCSELIRSSDKKVTPKYVLTFESEYGHCEHAHFILQCKDEMWPNLESKQIWLLNCWHMACELTDSNIASDIEIDVMNEAVNVNSWMSHMVNPYVTKNAIYMNVG